MPAWMMQFLFEILPQVPELVKEGENLFAAIAHGEGGADKINRVLAGAATLTSHAAAVASSIHIPAAPPVGGPAASGALAGSYDDPAATTDADGGGNQQRAADELEIPRRPQGGTLAAG